jgi:hypothetical protein
MTNVTGMPNLKDKKYGGAYSVYDTDTVMYRNILIDKYTSLKQDDETLKQKYFHKYKEWISSTHTLEGFNDFNETCFTNGTTESFANFYIRYRNNKRLRLAKGEYFYHQMMKVFYFTDNFAWLDEEDLKEGDVLLISAPFADTGDLYPNLEDILKQCDNKNIPVMLDLAYINIANNLKINLNHSCIEYVVSSLSKVFPVEQHRIGIRWQRKKYEDQSYVINEPGYNYINMLSVYLGFEMMNFFPADYIFKKYRDKQIDFCNKLNLEISECVYFGIDHNNNYSEYNRGGTSNRLCFSRIWDGRMHEL